MLEGASEGQAEKAVTLVPSTVLSFSQEQRRILEAIAGSVPTAQTLDLITKLVEREAPGLHATILLLDGTQLRHGSAPSIPSSYNEAIDGLEIGPTVGSCGAAAATGKAVVVEDVQTHPNWAPFRDLAAAHGLRACWSTPIKGAGQKVLGTFALYHTVPRGPTAHELHLVAEATHLASIAIQHDRLLRAEAQRAAHSQQRSELRDLLRHAPVAVALVLGPDLVFEFANAAYERLVHRKNVEGKRVLDVFPETKGSEVYHLISRVFASGEPFEIPELRLELDRGRGLEEAWFSGRLEPYKDPNGNVIGIFSVSVEITEQVRARQELDLRRAEIATHEKASALGQLVSGVAHEIRTPLTYLATNLNLIQLRLDRLLRDMPPKQAEACHMLIDQYIPSALEGVDRISHIVEDLREFTQYRQAMRGSARMSDVVGQAVSLFQATHRGRVSVDLAPSTDEDAEILVDKVQVQQALLNLLQNAFDADPRDHTIRVRTFADSGSYSIEVSDTGRGIPVGAQPRIFDPFYTTREGGTGLGLSIVKRIVEDHRGQVSFVTSHEGTTFRLVFPR